MSLERIPFGEKEESGTPVRGPLFRRERESDLDASTVLGHYPQGQPKQVLVGNPRGNMNLHVCSYNVEAGGLEWVSYNVEISGSGWIFPAEPEVMSGGDRQRWWPQFFYSSTGNQHLEVPGLQLNPQPPTAQELRERIDRIFSQTGSELKSVQEMAEEYHQDAPDCWVAPDLDVLAEIREVAGRLEPVHPMGTHSDVESWLRTAHPLFGGKTPAEMIDGSDQDRRKLAAALSVVEQDAFV